MAAKRKPDTKTTRILVEISTTNSPPRASDPERLLRALCKGLNAVDSLDWDNFSVLLVDGVPPKKHRRYRYLNKPFEVPSGGSYNPLFPASYRQEDLEKFVEALEMAAVLTGYNDTAKYEFYDEE